MHLSINKWAYFKSKAPFKSNKGVGLFLRDITVLTHDVKKGVCMGLCITIPNHVINPNLFAYCLHCHPCINTLYLFEKCAE